jgi:hypothetical protein
MTIGGYRIRCHGYFRQESSKFSTVKLSGCLPKQKTGMNFALGWHSLSLINQLYRKAACQLSVLPRRDLDKLWWAEKMSIQYHQSVSDSHLELLKEATKPDLNLCNEDGITPTLLAATMGIWKLWKSSAAQEVTPIEVTSGEILLYIVQPPMAMPTVPHSWSTSP